MSIKQIIKESMDKNPLGLKEALAEELRARVALALEAKMSEDDDYEDEDLDEGIDPKLKKVADKHGVKLKSAKSAHEFDYNRDAERDFENAGYNLRWNSKKSQFDIMKESFDLSDLTLEELEDFMVSEDFDQLDEISKKTLASYVKKASQSAADNAEKSGKHYEKSANASDIDTANRYFDSYAAKGAKSNRRLKGISRATDRLAK
jgi:hypothetical protein